MTPAQLASYIRWKGNVPTSSPWDNTSLLPIVNIAKDNITQAIVQVNPDYFGEKSHADTVTNQQEYTKPTDLLLMKRMDVSYSDTNVGSFHPAKFVTLADLLPQGEDYYATNQPSDRPLIRFDDTGFFMYPTPTSTTSGTAFLNLWYVPKRADLANLTEASTDIETTLGIGSYFHELIGDVVVNQIKYKKSEITQTDLAELNAHILDVLVPSGFRILSTVTSKTPSDSNLQY